MRVRSQSVQYWTTSHLEHGDMISQEQAQTRTEGDDDSLITRVRNRLSTTHSFISKRGPFPEDKQAIQAVLHDSNSFSYGS